MYAQVLRRISAPNRLLHTYGHQGSTCAFLLAAKPRAFIRTRYPSRLVSDLAHSKEDADVHLVEEAGSNGISLESAGNPSAVNSHDAVRTDSAETMRTASEATNSATTTLPPLPDLPPKPKGYPTPHLTDADMASLQPLFARHWWVSHQRQANATHAYIPRLTKKFTFEGGFDVGMKFLGDVAKAAKAENHHPFMTIQNNEVFINTWTHSAKSPSTDQFQPGLTQRDLRLALLVEHAAAPYPHTHVVPEPDRQPQTTAGLQRHTGRQKNLKCPRCGGTHRLWQCPQTEGEKPPSACRRCGGDHWMRDCQVGRVGLTSEI